MSRDYIFGTVNDQPRLTEYYRLIKPFFLSQLEHLFDDKRYELAEVLTRQRPTKSQVLDAGCGEGLYLHDLALLLEKRQILEQTNLVGVDNDRTVVATAEDYKLVTKPPRPDIHFYTHNLRQPLADNPDLPAQISNGLDFVYAMRVVSYIPNAKQVVKQLYDAVKPGGLIYFMEAHMHESEQDGWVSPDATRPVFEAFTKLVLGLNGGVEVSAEIGNWLKELGAEHIEIRNDYLQSKGDGSAESLQLLRILVATGRNILPTLVATKIMTQTEANAAMEQIFKELNMNAIAQFTLTSIIARKPW